MIRKWFIRAFSSKPLSREELFDQRGRRRILSMQEMEMQKSVRKLVRAVLITCGVSLIMLVASGIYIRSRIPQIPGEYSVPHFESHWDEDRYADRTEIVKGLIRATVIARRAKSAEDAGEQASDDAILRGLDTDASYAPTVAFLVDSGQIDDAVKVLLAHLRRSPTDSAAWYQLGQLQLYMKDLRRAKIALECAAAIDPDWVEVLNDLSIIYYEQGDFQDALDVLTMLEELTVDRTEVIFNKALCLLALEDYERALEAFSRYLWRQRDDVLALREKARLEVLLSRPDDAVETINTALAIAPDSNLLLVDAAAIEAFNWDVEELEDALEKVKDRLSASFAGRLLQAPLFDGIRLTEAGARLVEEYGSLSWTGGVEVASVDWPQAELRPMRSLGGVLRLNP